MSLQNNGIAALLSGDLATAVAAYRQTYDLWPNFRNVQEIKWVLERRANCFKDRKPSDAERLEILHRLRVIDFRDLDPDLKRQLADQGKWNEKLDLKSPVDCMD